MWLAIACAVALACSPPAERSASIVLIIIDTLRADKLGAYGFADCSSPEIDAYAARGIRFGRVFAQSSWTTPSIGSMLTSLYPRTLAIFDATRDTLGLQYETLSEVLHAAGYQTLGATANPNINGTFHFNQGFDQYFDSDWGWSPDEKQHVRFHTAPEILNRVLRWIDDHPFDGPRYVQVNLMDVHQSFEVDGGQARPTPVPLFERAKRSWSEWRCDRSRPKSLD